MEQNKNLRKVRSSSYIESKNKNEMYILYNIDDKTDKKKIKLFDGEFVKRNKDKSYIIVNGIKMELCEYYNYSKEKDKNIIEMKEKVLLIWECSWEAML